MKHLPLLKTFVQATEAFCYIPCPVQFHQLLHSGRTEGAIEVGVQLHLGQSPAEVEVGQSPAELEGAHPRFTKVTHPL